MDKLIYNIANFYSIIVSKLASAGLNTVITVSVTAVLSGAGAIFILWQYIEWVKECQTNSIKSFVHFFKVYAKLFAIWILVSGSPVLFGTLNSWASTRVMEAANGPMVDATQALFTQMMDTTLAMVELEGAYAEAMFNANPATNFMTGNTLSDLTGMSDTQAQAALLNASQAQTMAMRDLQAQLTAAQKMATSTNPDRARIGAANVADIQVKIDSTNTTLQSLKSQQKPVPAPKDDGWFARLISGVMTISGYITGIASLAYTLPWMVIYHLAAIIILLPGILLGLWGAWKLIGAAVELFSYLFSFAAKVIVAAMISVGLAPLSMLSLLFPSTQEYGKHLISWWFQAIVATMSLGVVVTLGAFGIGAITDSVGGLTVELTRVLLGGLAGTASPSVALFDSVAAGSALLAVGYSMSFLTQFVKGAISASAGLVSGHFHAH